VTAVYIETSALLRWVFGEHGAGRVASLMESAPDPVSSVLTLLEAQRAIVRARSQDSAAATSTLRLVELLVRLSRRWTLAEVSADVRARAARSFPVEPVRTLDAIHLSTALEFAKVFPGLSVLTFDRRILANLEPLGLTPATVDG
jgi:predicted nucleic acid-binding protein